MSYVVLFRCPASVVETKARRFRLEEGLYAYVGSCGVSCHRRIARHLRRPARRHWHVDYLPCEAVASLVTRLGEPELALRLSAHAEYVKGFGSTDDRRAPSHLFRVKSLAHLLDAISAAPHDQLSQADLR
jgi:Uri superfamily endonuclease